MAEILKIRSDFTDYYDAPCSAEGGKSSKAVVYDRYRINRTRIADLQELRFLGIRTLEIKPVSKVLLSRDDRVCVYTDLMSHGREGVISVTYNEAVEMYHNRLCSTVNWLGYGYIYKYIQVGTRRFWITTDRSGNVLGMREMESGYSLIQLPIYSIDYISVGGVQTAVDFNTVQRLSDARMEFILPSVDVRELVYAYLTRGK